MSDVKKEKVFKILEKFKNKHDITCPESIYQCDSVIVDLQELVEEMMESAGFFTEEAQGE